MRSLLLATVTLVAVTAAARAQDPCPGNPDALGTARVVAIDPKATPYLGAFQYKQTVPLQKGEVILTFDDGPIAPYTSRVLDTLREQCVKATFFIVGQMARGNKALLQRIAADGHTIGTHSQTHPLIFPKLTQAEGLKEINQGFASTNAALAPIGGHAAPFFRFPGLGRTKFYEAYTRDNGIAVFSVDLVADDWMHLKPDEVLKRALDRLEARGSGILLLHDIQPSTAVMLPTFLKELKARGFKVVHMVPADPSVVPNPVLRDMPLIAEQGTAPAGAARPTVTPVRAAGPKASDSRPAAPAAAETSAPQESATPAPDQPMTLERFFSGFWPRLPDQ